MTDDIETLRRKNARLQVALSEANAAREACAQRAFRLESEVERLREALQAALDGGCSYVHANEDDEIGRHGCCDALSYKPHEPDCWTLKAKAALRREEP